MKKHLIYLIVGFILLLIAFCFLNGTFEGKKETADNKETIITEEAKEPEEVTKEDITKEDENISSDKATPAFERELYFKTPRMTGEDVLEAQKVLKDLGYYTGELDGIFGPLTLDAVEGYQTDYKLYDKNDKEYGVIEEKTWLKLFEDWGK